MYFTATRAKCLAMVLAHDQRLMDWMKASSQKAKVAKQMIGRRLSQAEAKRLLAKLE